MYHYDVEKNYSYIKGYATALNFQNTIKTLYFAREKHHGQNRKDGQPYIIHPLTMCSHAICLGLKDDILLASTLLHDVVEDCNVSLSELPVDAEVKEVVKLLTYKKPARVEGITDFEYNGLIKLAKDKYYEQIADDETATLCKLLDRCHNVSSMAESFTYEKIKSYITETRDYIIPLIRSAKEKWPIYNDVLFIFKYQIISVTDSIEDSIRIAEEHIKKEYGIEQGQ